MSSYYVLRNISCLSLGKSIIWGRGDIIEGEVVKDKEVSLW